jgi:L-lactate dehydrogenase complex protein LldG
MNLEGILKEERILKGKESLREAFLSYYKSREEAFRKIDVKELKERLRKIKEFSIANLENLKEKAIKNLSSQGIQVHEAKTASEACEIALKLIPKGEKIVKAKSNVINEIGLLEKLEGRNEVIETDCGDFLVKLCNEKPSHPVIPALHLSSSQIAKKIKEKFGVDIKENAKEIVEWVKNYLKEKILEAKIGLTGVNAISSDGAIFILENEGNISLVSRIPEKHIIFAGIDKIVPSLQDALIVCQASAIWGTGGLLPTYINIISSPSKTADVENKIVYGVHGAKEIHLILVDNGRSEIIKEGFGELLYCINCGSCLYFCPVYGQILDNYGLTYFAARGIGMLAFQENLERAFERGLYYCTTCKACKENCPLDLDLPELVRKLRNKAIQKGLETLSNKKMIENIIAFGNPFGKLEEGKIPKELYCC